MTRTACPAAGPARRSLLRLAWGSRWGLLRLSVAVFLLHTVVGDNPSRLTRLQIAAMPDYDYLAEVQRLRHEERFGEAIVVADAGLESLRGEPKYALGMEKEKVEADRDSWLRKTREFGAGALAGQGKSVESLAGAITADMLIVGDVRDLIIQGGKWVADGETDKVILALSAVGVLTTVLPEIDWAASLLKVARKVGAIGGRMGEAIVRACRKALKTKEYGALKVITYDVVTISKKSSPAGTIRILRHVEDPEDLAKVARFLERAPEGAFALHVAGKEGVSIVTSGTREAEAALRQVARKGDRGIAWLRSGKMNLLRPHPLVGLLKSWDKGNLSALAEKISRNLLDPYGFAVIPLLLLWVAVEVWLILRRFLSNRIGRKPASQTAA